MVICKSIFTSLFILRKKNLYEARKCHLVLQSFRGYNSHYQGIEIERKDSVLKLQSNRTQQNYMLQN